jgi:hypothetical protein
MIHIKSLDKNWIFLIFCPRTLKMKFPRNTVFMGLKVLWVRSILVLTDLHF